MAACWSSKGRAFEYECRFTVDEEIIPFYTFTGDPEWVVVVEIRTNFLLQLQGEEDKKTTLLGSERFGSSHRDIPLLRWALAVRLRDYWLSPPQIESLLDAALLFSAGRPTVLDLEVRTVQAEGEAPDAALARAMRPGTLRPLNLTDSALLNPDPKPEEIFESDEDLWDERVDPVAVFNNVDKVDFLGEVLYNEDGVRVDDADEGLAVMQECGICRGKPFVGTVIAKLRCGHLFHYHCVVWPLKDHRACPVCGLPPYDLLPVINLLRPLPTVPPPRRLRRFDGGNH